MILSILLIAICVYFMWSDLRNGLLAHSEGKHGWASFYLISMLWFSALLVYNSANLYRDLYDKPAETCKSPLERPSP